ncbi:type III effector protein, partial [Ralstonia pseudosolanacearum]
MPSIPSRSGATARPLSAPDEPAARDGADAAHARLPQPARPAARTVSQAIEALRPRTRAPAGETARPDHHVIDIDPPGADANIAP